MPWVLAIMMFLTLLAAAAGFGLGSAARSLSADVGNRATVQIVEANPDRREAEARAATALLQRQPGVEGGAGSAARERHGRWRPGPAGAGLAGGQPGPARVAP